MSCATMHTIPSNGFPKLWGVGEAVIASPANFEKETDMTTTFKQSTWQPSPPLFIQPA